MRIDATLISHCNPEKIPDRFMTDEANEVGAMVDRMQPSTR